MFELFILHGKSVVRFSRFSRLLARDFRISVFGANLVADACVHKRARELRSKSWFRIKFNFTYKMRLRFVVQNAHGTMTCLISCSHSFLFSFAHAQFVCENFVSISVWFLGNDGWCVCGTEVMVQPNRHVRFCLNEFFARRRLDFNNSTQFSIYCSCSFHRKNVLRMQQ